MNWAISVALVWVLAVPGPGPGPNAGSVAGVGRAHPGRSVSPVLEVPVVPGVAPAVVQVPEDDPGPAQPRRGGVVLEVLPLGAGFTLMGVGLGFIGLRLRRGLLR
ncbi:hypothetical protein OG607_22090 [Streptomyces sp. NBC_01537]|uniref:hypothetical protein n=1 Tax=Streptomyces sp. NBC_01537 TaxID=2903896 RepID=UPI00387054C2